MANGEKIRRSWLMYSVQKDAIFCFCCKLFGTGDIPLRGGTSAWKALSKRLQQHETGKGHQDCMVKWFDLWSGIVNRTSVDQLELQAFLKEKEISGEMLSNAWLMSLFSCPKETWHFEEVMKSSAILRMATFWDCLNCLQSTILSQRTFTEDYEGRDTCSVPQSTDPKRADSTCCQ